MGLIAYFQYQLVGPTGRGKIKFITLIFFNHYSFTLIDILEALTSELKTNRKTVDQLLPEMERLNCLSYYVGSVYKRK